MHISVSRIIHAEKSRIMRLLTKPWEFPGYVPTVKEVNVIGRAHNTVRTRWRVQVDHVPITWIEEEMLSLRHNVIQFKAIEGDLRNFKGQWTFSDHPQGTAVKVDVHLEVDIPAIGDFASSYIEKIVFGNFEAILNAVEQRLISLRYEKYRQGDKEQIAGFGIIGHLYNYYHLERCLKMLKPDFKMPSREFISQLFGVTPSFKLYDIKGFQSKTSQSVDGCFIVATFIPDLIEQDIWSIFSKVVRGCKIAEKHGVGVVALGGFTSIVAERIGEAISNQVDVPVTTGNTFTAAMVIEGVRKAARAVGLELSSSKAAIVGGTGDIGSGCARVLAGEVKQLTITGRTKSNLRRLRLELAKKRKARIVATVDNKVAVKDADIVIATASVTSSILNVDYFKPGAIICDVGYPKNISYTQTSRRDIFVFSGGLATTPTPIAFPIDLGLPSPDTIYGCFAEAIILSLEKRYEGFSFGRGNIMPEKIEEIRALGEKHGFRPSPFYWGGRLIDEEALDEIKGASQKQVDKR